MPGRPAAVPLLFILLLSACDSPTGVGSGLVGDVGGAPTELAFSPADMATAVEADYTGGSGTLQRMLVGVVDDPALGQIRATGHMDFVSPSTGLSDAFSGGTVTGATLVLNLVYVYGDTTGSVTVRLNDLQDEFAAAEARADTTFAAGEFVTEQSIAVTRASVSIPLPSDWITRWDGTLRGSSFSEDFHGFRLEAVAGNAVVGFQLFQSYLDVVSGGDTLAFGATSVHSSLEFQEPFSTPQDMIVLQDGRGVGTALQFDLDDDRLDLATLSRARLELPFDSTLTNQAPAGFYRPAASLSGLELDVVGVDPVARYVLDATAVVSEGVLRFESSDLLAVVRLILDGDSSLDHFELRVNPAVSSLDVLHLALPTHPTSVPRAVLTAVPFDR